MFTKTNKEMNNFISDIKTIKNHKMLLDYMTNDFYAGIKLLISVSSTFSIFWKFIVPFIVSLGSLLLLSNIKPIGDDLDKFVNTTYIFVIFLFLVVFSSIYISHCKKYFISGIEKSMSDIKDD